jgi:plastocyanin
LGIILLGLLCSAIVPTSDLAQAQAFTVNGSVQVTNASSHRRPAGNANVVVWLAPLKETNSSAAVPEPSTQKNKIFEPHELVVPVGSDVEFPNKDPFFHNVFSLFEGKRFDLGLYEAGSTRSLRFDRPGVSYLFCNIHSEMSAVIIALDTPYYATSNQTGEISIPNVPAGRYWLHVWKEGAPTDALKSLSRMVVVSPDSTSLGKLMVPNSTSVAVAHKNKYGKDYEDPTPPGQIYDDH